MGNMPILLTTAASLPTLVSSSSSSSFHGSLSAAFLPSYVRTPLNLASRPRTANDHVAMLTTSLSAAMPGKGNLYDDEELFDLLNLHKALNPEEEKGLLSGGENGDLNEESIVGGIHDWVLQTLDGGDDNGMGQNGDFAKASAIPGLHELILETIEDIESSSSPSASSEEDESSPTINQAAFSNLQALLRDKKPAIRAVATDVDGTLLSGRYLHPITRDAVVKAIEQAYGVEGGSAAEEPSRKIRHFFPATGKSRRGAEISLGPVVGPLLRRCPGVYIQGLYCVDGEGNVVFEKKLPASVVRAAEDLAAEFGVSVVGYDGDDLYTTGRTAIVASLSEVHGESPVELIAGEDGDPAMKLAEHGPGMHKLLLMDEDLERLAAFRLRLEELAGENGASVTQAIPTMLELLPGGCSKADGVERLCEALGIDAGRELLALGDAENDAGMLENAAVGVAVGNACPRAMDAADFVMRECHEEGAAGLAMNLFGFDV